MSASDPRIAFGVQALGVAMAAKSGRLPSGDVRALDAAADVLVPGDVDVRTALDRFVALAGSDIGAAGRALHDFLMGWPKLPRDTDACPPEFDWQRRADCGGG